jgi:peptide/nickel transport system permease protein
MWKYILKRFVWLIFVLLGTAVLIFTILYFTPGDPAALILGVESTEADRLALRVSMGLEDPYLVQLGRFLYNTFLRFDFGTSYVYGTPVVAELASRLPRTMILCWSSMIVHTAIGLPLGIAAALHHNKWQDYFCMVVALIGVSMPSFWTALLLVMLFSLKLGWLPAMGIGGAAYYILPVTSNSIQGIAMTARQTRSSMLENIRADFVTTARAKGVPEHSVTYKHIVPNAMIPIITLLGTEFAYGIASTVVIENVFSFPGIGAYLTTAVTARDYPVVQSCVVILAAFAAVVQVLVDLVYAYVDPRIKAQYASGR